ncbi:phosphatase PAP2 family protein [Nocardioides dongxiaopingii]|uniref:phosphatase PAP2 family protein n=1 Tax=Nocardioides dongxiaopingii TaxID=2576036 RepID=UPI0010C76262|nr:phosphatase PAP2 family protein [Nocardioides dongxiaopingii]
MQESVGVRAVLERNFGYAWAAGIAMAVATVVFAAVAELPIRDPDNFVPGYIRFPAIVFGAIALDVLPRLVWRLTHGSRGAVETLRGIMRERWTKAHWLFALSGIGAWYLTYAAFRNLKSFVPFVNGHNWDAEFRKIDQVLWFGHDPAVLMHDLFGTGIASHVFSGVYFIWIALVPVSIAIALVWTRSRTASSWYVTAVAFDWLLGAAVYLMLPSVGPVYTTAQRGQFDALDHTYNTDLANSMWDDRVAVVGDVFGSGTLQTIAAFPSLHTGIMVTICVFAQYVGLARWIRVVSWVFLGLTIVATLYLGWHYFVDVLGGVALGSVTVWLAALATGNHDGLRPRLKRAEVTDDVTSTPVA